MSRIGFAMRAGITFGGSRDLYSALGYTRDLTARDYRDRYRRGGIAARVVEALPKATWRGGAELVEDQDPTIDTAFEDAWNALNRRLNAWSAFRRVDVLAGLGRYAILLIGAPGKLDTPLPKRLVSDDIVYLQPYSEEDAAIMRVDDDPSSARFGYPTAYQISRRASLSSTLTSMATLNVHYTRVLHVADDVLDERIAGNPRLERVWNYLDDLEKIVGGGSESFWRRAHQGVIFNLDKDLEITAEEAKKIEEAADELVHDVRRTMAVRGMETTMLGSDVANFANQVDAIITLIAGASGTPKRILVGSERGELSSTQDRENWEQLVRDRRTDFAGPSVVFPFVDLMIERGALPTPEQYSIRWPEIEALTAPEQADIATKWAGLNSSLGSVVVTGQEIRDRILRLDPLTEEQIAEQEKIRLAPTTPAPAVPPDPNAPPQPPPDPNTVPKAPAPTPPIV
jgi:hypothetical protein